MGQQCPARTQRPAKTTAKMLAVSCCKVGEGRKTAWTLLRAAVKKGAIVFCVELLFFLLARTRVVFQILSRFASRIIKTFCVLNDARPVFNALA